MGVLSAVAGQERVDHRAQRHSFGLRLEAR
jgi:hypothetical protein